MADISITAANVVAGASAQKASGTAGAAITAGQQVYPDPITKTYLLADNNSATAAARKAKATALNNAAAGQPLAVQGGGDITIGATLTPGVPYFLSDTPGGICPYADLASGEFVTLVGIAKSATVLQLGYQSVDVSL